MLHGGGTGGGTQQLEHVGTVLARLIEDAHLDELVRGECAVSLADHAGTETIVADLHHGSEAVGARPQFAALRRGDRRRRLGRRCGAVDRAVCIHRPHDTAAGAPVAARWIIAVMIKKASSKRWMREHVTDPFVKQAQKDGYRSRAAYKLLEIAQKDKLLRPGAVVFDLGAAPGGWAQVAAKAVGTAGRVFAVDLLPLQPIHGVHIVQGDFTQPQTRATLLAMAPGGADLVLSDMAPNITGITDRDQRLSFELAELAVGFAAEALRPGGAVLLKVFQSEWVEGLRADMAELFQRVSVRKPEASRGRSAEVFLLGAGLRETAAPSPAQSP